MPRTLRSSDLQFTILFSCLGLLSGPASPSTAQEVPEDCGYDACALRVEPGGLFSRATVVRGREGIEVGPRDRTAEMEGLFQRDDSASVYFSEHAESDRRADWLDRLSGGLFLASLGVIAAGDDNDGWFVGLNVGGFILGLASIVPRRRASRAFSNAVSWYNRSLVPEDPP